MNKDSALRFRSLFFEHSIPTPSLYKEDEEFVFEWESFPLIVKFSNETFQFSLYRGGTLMFYTKKEKSIISEVQKHFPYRVSEPIMISNPKSRSY